jgi:GNAT superfamily N-acetyltransferase
MNPVQIPGVALRRANPLDASELPAIENSAGDLFRQVPWLAHLADGEDLSADWYREMIAKGASWVAIASDRLIGFLCAERERDVLHLWELGVRQEWQRRGVGRALVVTALEEARRCGLSAATLTTFTNIAWNAPFYTQLGFETLSANALDDHLAAALQEDANRNLPLYLRCAMRLSFR